MNINKVLVLLQEANRTKSEFLSRMSHEMLTPMHAIMGMTAIAKMQGGMSLTLKECIDEIDSASRHLLSLINDLLDFTDMESNVFELTESLFSFKNMICTLIKDIERGTAAKQQVFNQEIDLSIPDMLAGDEKHLVRVLRCLLGNAIKFTPAKGEIGLSVFMLSGDNETVALQVEVTDNGVGISQEQQKKIFNLFEQMM